MLKIYNDTKFYVASPPVFQTGGTEALHVLAFELRNLGIDAVMLYRDANPDEDVVGERFKKFNVPYVFEIEDTAHNILIVPEVWSDFLQRHHNLQKVFWWLSVDNYFDHLKATNHKKNIFHYIKALLKQEKSNKGINFKDESILHLAQSEYALDFLEKKKVFRKAFLADYLGADFFEKEPYLSSKKREDIVLYNPKKGFEFTKELISKDLNIKFLPLENMTTAQVRDLCSKSKVYIDFGNHPGKDRFPRETAIQGNIVITGNKGSAAFYKDVPILKKYKFSHKRKNYEKIIALIKDCLVNYDTHISDFEVYRQFICQDKERFIQDLKNLINK